MIRAGHQFAIIACVAGLVSCADHRQAETPPVKASAAPEAPAKPTFKKEVRMNGRGEITSISLEDFFVLQQSGKVLLFDARPAFFYNLGHIPGAINLSKNNCDEAIQSREAEIKSALAAGKTIVVYCTSITCPDARTVARHLAGFGHPSSIFAGGWDAWKDAGMPLE